MEGKQKGSSTGSGTSGTGQQPEEIVESVRNAASSASQGIQEQVSGITEQVRTRATDQVATQMDKVVDTLETVALLLKQSGEWATQQEKPVIADYLDQASGHVDQWRGSLSSQEPGEILEQTKQFASRQPLLFVGGALAAGFLGTRFLRASQQNVPSADASGMTGNYDSSYASGTGAAAARAGTSGGMSGGSALNQPAEGSRDYFNDMPGMDTPSDRGDDVMSSGSL